jgi:protein TonB
LSKTTAGRGNTLKFTVICTDGRSVSSRSIGLTFTACVLITAALISPALAESTVEPPVPVRTVAPDYPTELRGEGVSGLVVVTCSIDHQGNVTETVVEKSSNAAFESHAVAALKKWKFKPAKRDGTPTSVRVSIPVKFVAQT